MTTADFEIAGTLWTTHTTIPVRRRQKLIERSAKIDKIVDPVEKIDAIIELAGQLLIPASMVEFERRIHEDNIDDPLDVDDMVRLVVAAFAAQAEKHAEETGAPLDASTGSTPTQETRPLTGDSSETGSISTPSLPIAD